MPTKHAGPSRLFVIAFEGRYRMQRPVVWIRSSRIIGPCPTVVSRSSSSNQWISNQSASSCGTKFCPSGIDGTFRKNVARQSFVVPISLMEPIHAREPTLIPLGEMIFPLLPLSSHCSFVPHSPTKFHCHKHVVPSSSPEAIASSPDRGCGPRWPDDSHSPRAPQHTLPHL